MSKGVIRRYSTLFKSFCVSAMTRLWIFAWRIYELGRIQTSPLVWGSWVVGRALLFFKGSCLFHEGALVKVNATLLMPPFSCLHFSSSAALHLQELAARLTVCVLTLAAPARIKAWTTPSGSSFMKTFNKKMYVCISHSMSFPSAS